MKNLEQEIINYHNKKAEIEKENATLSKMGTEIIEKYCPFKIEDKVIFTEWWRDNGKEYFGIVKNILFKGIDDDAIDNRWVIVVEPTTKDFSKSKGGYNASYKYLGEHKEDVIRKV